MLSDLLVIEFTIFIKDLKDKRTWGQDTVLSIRLSQRAKYLTLFFFCKLKERVIQHEVLWPEVPLDTIDASLQTTAFKHAPPNMRIVNMSNVHRRVKEY